jgi:hypothetical protein
MDVNVTTSSILGHDKGFCLRTVSAWYGNSLLEHFKARI